MKLYNLDNLACDDCRHQRNGKCTGGSWFCDHMEMFTLSGEAMKRREVEAVPIVRCKDCARDGRYDCPLCYIEKQTLTFINHDPEFYCGYGEVKNEDSLR